MRAGLTASLAWRFLRSKKSHGAVSAVAAVAVAGVAVATAAIVCVLSVFNGFKEVLTDKLDSLTPDVTVTAVSGRPITDGDSLLEVVKKVPGVAFATQTVSDQALSISNGAEMPIRLKGVDYEEYRRVVNIDSLIITGTSDGKKPAGKWGIPSIGTAFGLGNVQPGENILVFTPRRYGRVNMSNPANAFLTDSVTVAGVFEAKQNDFDKDMLIVPAEIARELFQYDMEATAIEVRAQKGLDASELSDRIEKTVGPQFSVLDRLESHRSNFKMVNIEKWVTYLLLFFIVIIAGFNIISTLSMLVLEKERQLSTLRSMGLSPRSIGSVFAWESFYVALLGGGTGIVLGVSLCLLQQHFGFIKLGGDPTTLILASYPVKVIPSDIIATLVPIAVIGGITALSASGFARKRSMRSSKG